MKSINMRRLTVEGVAKISWEQIKKDWWKRNNSRREWIKLF